MDLALWIVTWLLAAVFLLTGVLKLVVPRATLLRQRNMEWVEDFSAPVVKGIGLAELLGAIGLVAPAFVEGREWLVPVAATGLVLVMIGAVYTHLRRKEPPFPPLVLGLLAAFVALGRFWLEPLT